jgi:hypothetical protein
VSVDWTKPIQTRSGRAVRYIGRDVGMCVRVAIVVDEKGTEFETTYYDDGRYWTVMPFGQPNDIINKET